MIKQGRGHILIIELVIKCLHVGSGIPLDSLGNAHTSYQVVALMARVCPGAPEPNRVAPGVSPHRQLDIRIR